MVLAMFILPGVDVFAKILTATLPVGQIACARFVFQVLFLLPFMLWLSGPAALRPGRAGVHALRGILLGLVALFLFAALKVMPIADAIAVFFIGPLLLTLLSALFLGERVGWRRLLAVMCGFLGALFIIQPGLSGIGWHVLLPAASALSFALYMVVTRATISHGDPVMMQCHSGLHGALFLAVALVIGTFAGVEFLTPVVPTMREWLLMAGLGVVSTAGHLLVVFACRHAGGVVLAPLQYLEIIGATLLGLLFFGDFPAPLTWLGIAVIITSGVFVAYRERIKAQPIAGSATLPRRNH